MDKLRQFALKHEKLLSVYRRSFGLLKTKYYFGRQIKALQCSGLDIIRTINKALDEAGGRYFVDCGTLLGVVRDGKLIDNDRDIDYGIYLDTSFTAEMLDEAMEKASMKKSREFIYDGKISELSYKSGILNIDFFCHEEQNDDSVFLMFHRYDDRTYPSPGHYTPVEFRRKHITGIKRILVNGVEINVPENSEEYLASAYTDSWRIPDPHWHTFEGPDCHPLAEGYGTIKK